MAVKYAKKIVKNFLSGLAGATGTRRTIKTIKDVSKIKRKGQAPWYTKKGMEQKFEENTGVKVKDIKSGRVKISK